MDERVVKFRVGVMVISTMFIAGILILLFGDTRSFLSGSYTVYIHFTDAPGVTEGTPVRKSGILIGRVHKVEFAKQGGVIVQTQINSGVKLFHNEVPQVTGSLLGGDVVIQFVRRGTAPNIEPVPPPAGNPNQSAAEGATTTLTAQITPPPGGNRRRNHPKVRKSSRASSSKARSRPMLSRSSAICRMS